MPLRELDVEFSELAVLCFCSQPTGGLNNVIFPASKYCVSTGCPPGPVKLRNKALQPSTHRHMIQILTRKRMHRQ